MALLRGPAEGEFAWHEISTRVNRVVNDDAQLMLPITDEQRAAEEPKPAKKAAPRKATPAASDDDGQGSLFSRVIHSMSSSPRSAGPIATGGNLAKRSCRAP